MVAREGLTVRAGGERLESLPSRARGCCPDAQARGAEGMEGVEKRELGNERTDEVDAAYTPAWKGSVELPGRALSRSLCASPWLSSSRGHCGTGHEGERDGKKKRSLEKSS